MANFKKHLAIPVICTILFFGGLLIYVKEMKKEQAMTPSPTPAVSETEKDGVYTNYKYGFSFEYPHEIFNTSNPWNENTGKMFFIDREVTPQIRVSASNGELNTQALNNCINTKKGGVITSSAKFGTEVKLYNIVNGCVLASDPRGLKDGEPAWTYRAYFKKEDQIIVVSLIASKEEDIKKYKADFDKIVRSFHFN